ncbi:MAG TPA: AAA family ATPase, partial [Oceanipulchritudo sp.]|nr:AAA family ATPase [Oceanipulchritudo sp.]
KIRDIKARIEEAGVEEQRAQRAGDLSKVAEIRYGRIVELEKQITAENERLAHVQQDRKMLKEEVDEEDVASVVAKWTGIPVDNLLSSEKDKLIHAEEFMAKRVVGQSEAISAVANAVRRARAGLQDPDRPLGSFIFLGPTGVGKTELARTLAEFLFDSEQAMVRLDMSEFMEKHSVARLIGAPPGYVGYEEGGYLTEAVRRKPYSVILFDEIEKAHPDVFNTLLQIMDDGRITDSQGHTVDFKNTVIILTSNIGSRFLSDGVMGDSIPESVRNAVFSELRNAFRPEFLNRLDDTILFRPLTLENISAIIGLLLADLNKRLRERQIEIVFDEKARHWFAEKGYDPVYGARPLKRLLQKQVENALARGIISGDIREGSIVQFSISDDHPVWTTVEPG